MYTRLYNARILTMNEPVETFDGEIWINDDKISYVGKHKSDDEIKNSGIKFDVARDCEGNVLMPSFKDAHTHSAMTGMRSSFASFVI